MKRLEEVAFNVIARHAIHCATEDGGHVPEWENYPEIGEDDWHDILAMIDQLSEAPSAREFDQAYALLTVRAENHRLRGEPS